MNTRTQGMESPQQSDAENLCSKQCTVTRPVLFDGPAGLVWLREDALTTGEASRPHPIVPDEIRIWHRDGLSEWLTLTPVAENYYRFVSPCPGGCGDSLAFLRGSTNVAGEDGYAESLFCQQEGSTISRPIRDLVDSLYYTDRLMDESPCSP